MRLALLVVAGCAELEPEYYYGPPIDVHPVDLWVDPGLDRSAVLAGCEAWAPEGLECTIVDDGRAAQMRVYASYSDCDEVVGFADNDAGNAHIYVDCLGDADLVSVAAHEIGHLMGIAEHVPAECDGDRWLCGPAVMNPYAEIARETLMDHAAFTTRNRCWSALSADGC